MEWGMPALMQLPGPEESAALCREWGFQFVELNMNLPEYQRLDIPQLRRVKEKFGIYFTVHLDENLDPCYFNPRVSNAYMDTLLETVCAAKELGVPVLNMHLAPGVHFTLPGEKVFLYEKYSEHYLGRLAEVIGRCEASAAGSGLRICIENCGDFAQPYKQRALDMFLHSPLFALTFDIGHDHTAGGVDKPFIMRHQERLCHFHIHDATNTKNHLPLGAGELDIPWYTALAEKCHCRAVLEVKTAQALKDSADWLRGAGLFGEKI